MVGSPVRLKATAPAQPDFLFQIDWPEPFGLAMFEAMARGTPVIGYPSGPGRRWSTTA